MVFGDLFRGKAGPHMALTDQTMFGKTHLLANLSTDHTVREIMFATVAMDSGSPRVLDPDIVKPCRLPNKEPIGLDLLSQGSRPVGHRPTVIDKTA